jgi:hypothetical protein
MRISEERAEFPSSVRSYFEIVRGCDAVAQNEIAGAARTFHLDVSSRTWAGGPEYRWAVAPPWSRSVYRPFDLAQKRYAQE